MSANAEGGCLWRETENFAPAISAGIGRWHGRNYAKQLLFLSRNAAAEFVPAIWLMEEEPILRTEMCLEITLYFGFLWKNEIFRYRSVFPAAARRVLLFAEENFPALIL